MVRSPAVDEKCSSPNRKMKAKILREFLGLSNHSNERIGLISKQVLYSSYDLVKSVVD